MGRNSENAVATPTSPESISETRVVEGTARPEVDAEAESCGTEVSTDHVDDEAAVENGVGDRLINVWIESQNGKFWRVSNVRVEEQVGTLKQLFAEVPTLSQYTSFTLQLVQPNSVPKKKSKRPITEPLNELHPLSEYPSLSAGGHIRVSPLPYTPASVYTHVQRLRESLANPAVSFNQMEEVPRDEALKTLQALSIGSKSSNGEATVAPPKETKDVKARSEGQNQHSDQVSEATDKAKRVREQLEMVSKLASDESIVPLQVNLSAFYPGHAQKQSGLDISSSYKSSDEAVERISLPACIKSIDFSNFNPPPMPRRLMGDLAYLTAETLEGKTIHITASPSGFYVNCTRGDYFDPAAASPPHFSQSLCELLQGVSPMFKKQYQELYQLVNERAKKAAQKTDLTEYEVCQLCSVGSEAGGVRAEMAFMPNTDNVQWNANTALSSPKLGDNNVHKQDSHRASAFLTESLALTSEIAPRDWNEEYQSTFELPMNTLEDRIFRARAMERIEKDFLAAATKGAIDILNGRIPSINPEEPVHTHVFVFQNIFYSLASLHDETSGAQEEVNVASYSMSNHDLGSLREVNDLLNTPPQGADLPDTSKNGIHTLATAVIDYLGRRVIAQGIIPGILQSDPANSLMYGTVNYGRSIAASPEFHGLLRPIAKHLHIKESAVHPVGFSEACPAPANSGLAQSNPEDVVKVFGAVESKGIRGADCRYYTLDLLRTTPVDMVYYARQSEGDALVVPVNHPSSYVALVRPELVRLHARHLQLEQEDKRKQRVHELLREYMAKHNSSEENDGKTEPSLPKEVLKEISEQAKNEFPDIEPIAYDVNTFTSVKSAKPEEERQQDEANVRALSKFLSEVRIPSFVDEVSRGMKLVADGKSLSESLHRAGINLRYLGEVCNQSIESEKSTRRVVPKSARLAEDQHVDVVLIPPMPRYFVELCEVEMVARAVKHLVRELFTQHPRLSAAPALALASVLSAIFGHTNKAARGDVSVPSFLEAHRLHELALKSPLLRQGSLGIWRQIRERVSSHFGYSLRIWSLGAKDSTSADDEIHDFPSRAHRLPLLRRVVQLLGLQIASRDYDLSGPGPAIEAADIVQVVPRVKSSMPSWLLPEARELLEYSRAQMSRMTGTPTDSAVLSQAFQWANQALQLVAQTVGTTHENAAVCSTVVAAILNEANELGASIAHERRALTFYDRNGHRDSPNVAYAHMKLSALYRRTGELSKAVLHVRRALYLFELMAGPNHSESAALYQQLGTLYAAGGGKAIAKSIGVLKEALTRCCFDRLQHARCLHSMAQACASAGDFAEAMKFQEVTRNAYIEVVGKEDSRTKDATDWFMVFASKHREQQNRTGGHQQQRTSSAPESSTSSNQDQEGSWKSVETRKSKKKGKKGKKGRGK